MKKFVTCILAVLLCVGMGSCGKTSSSDKIEQVTINCYSGNYVSATMQIIRHEKLMEKYLPEGVSVNYTELVSGPEIRDAVLAGDIQIADMSLMTFQSGIENDLPLTLLSFCGGTPIKIYSNREEIQRLEDFSGGEQITITNRATNLHAAYLAQVKEAGLDIDTYDKMLVATPNTEALALLDDGETVSGSVLSFPTYTKADDMDGVRCICEMDEAIQLYSVGSAFVTTADFYEAQPEVIAAFRSAQKDALELFESQPEYAAGILADLYKIDVEAVLNAIEIMPPTDSLAGYDKLADLLHEVGILTSEPTKFAELPNYSDIAELGA